MSDLWIYPVLGVLTLLAGAGISYFMASRIVPPFVIKFFEAKYTDPEFIQNTIGQTWEPMAEAVAPLIGKSIMLSLQGKALADVRYVQNAMDDIDDTLVSEVLPDIQITPENMHQILALSKKPAMARKLGEYMEMYQQFAPLLQGMQQAGGNGGYGPPSVHVINPSIGAEW